MVFEEDEGRGDPAERYVYCSIGKADYGPEGGAGIIFLTWLPGKTVSLYIRRLEFGAFQVASGTQTSVRIGIRYRSLGCVKASEERKRAETQKYLDSCIRRIEHRRGKPKTFGAYLSMAAEATGICNIIFMIPDGRLEILPVAEGAARIDRLLEDRQKAQARVAAGKA